MSEYSSHETMQRNTNERSPLVAGLLMFSMLLVLAGAGLGAWKFYAKTAAAKDATLKATQTDMQGQLRAYKVDSKSGALSQVDEWNRQSQGADYLPAVGDFELVDQTGRKITNKDLLGQPYAVSFLFTKCYGPCLDIRAKMAKLQRELKGAPVRLVTITVDPNHDTPEVLANYAEGVAADADRWHFLTGEPDYVYKVLRENFRQFVREETGKDRQRGYEVAHEAGVLHIDAQGRIVKRYLGSSDAEMMQLRIAVLKEAEQLAQQPADRESSDEAAVAQKPETRSEGGE